MGRMRSSLIGGVAACLHPLSWIAPPETGSMDVRPEEWMDDPG